MAVVAAGRTKRIGERDVKNLTRVALGVAGAAALVVGTAATANAATPGAPSSSQRTVGTVFVQSDNPQANTVVAYDRLQNGTLRQEGVYATGGKGGVLAGSMVDHLASQGSLVRSGNTLFAVNAGSNTVTSFGIVGDRLVRQQSVSSDGSFPVSVAAHGNQVYVLNARDGGSVQGYLNVGGVLVKIPSWHRSLGLDAHATPEFTHTPGEIAFTPDGSKVIVSTKGNTSAFDVFSVGAFGPAKRPVVTTFAGDVPFGFAFDRRGTLVASEAGPNAVATFIVHRDGTLTKNSETATGAAATCWITIDGEHVYASNAGTGTISGYTVNADHTLTATGTAATAEAGTVDTAVSGDGQYLYAQTGAAGHVDEFAVAADGTLTTIGSVVVPGAVGGEGIVAS
jgi:6-phosphogluconolactonase (cycloisomerase 2 family)